ncbi:Conserved oligomeric Golgi complex subunit 6 [Heterocephalus glaber]|uniref:Conserved oligomeric Golgi complex subunit 6 n=1 Tax=Heterocephalus glaber TaxID=10181 RepID=G5C344_HETGA|nr:Conserved oligomeric Golgi complex subunit 6 [Heterocephalus glaber]
MKLTFGLSAPPPGAGRAAQGPRAAGKWSPASGAGTGLSNGAGGTSAQPNNPLSRKLHKTLETCLDNDKEILEALKALSTFFVENSLQTRRNLRGDIERRSSAINEFVSNFKEVKEELESINEDVQATSSCQDMTSRLQAAKEQTQDVIVKPTKLQTESQRLEIRAQVADGFLSKFQLTSDEMSLLRGTREGPITEDFFKALGRVKQIHNDVKVLLRTNQQTAGLEIMEQMASLQETAYERLYRWAQSEYRTLTQESRTPRNLLKAIQGVEENIQEVVGHITVGVCRPLKVRIEQVILAELGAVLLYKISNLLKFYHHTISGIVGNSATTLLTTIEEMHLLSKKIFNSLSLHVSKLMEKIELPPPDIGPSSALNQTLMLLCEVLASHDSSVIPLDVRQADFVQVLSCVLDPLLQMCTVSASNLGTANMATFMVNSLYMMKTTLALFEFTNRCLEMLQFQTEAHLDTLINEQASYVLTRVGFSYSYNAVQQHKPEQACLANLPNLDSVALQAAMVQFDRYLSAPDNPLMPQLNFLPSATVKEQIVKQSTDLVCRAYGEVYAAVMSPANEYKDPESILHRSPQQVQALLS